jgi:hypothetical protein
MVARKAQNCQTTQRCRSADHRRMLGSRFIFLIFKQLQQNNNFKILQLWQSNYYQKVKNKTFIAD